jgi:predicted nuclease of restriction endonuclease-like (RecB) superfamily
MSPITLSKDYMSFLNTIKSTIQKAHLRAHLSVNKELTLLYWHIGNEILNRKKELGWGSDVVRTLAQDLKHEFPDIKGFGERNLVYMQTFATAYPDIEFTQALPAQITWYHNQTILDKIKEPELRKWYIEKTIECGWSRNVLVMQIENQTHLKVGKAQTNFLSTLPNPTSDLVQQIVKSEYNFDFLGLQTEFHERELEQKLVEHIRNFLLELGTGFSFLGSQYKLTVGDEDFYCDLLFYHVRLHCFFILELKTTPFKPEYVGKLGFYITAVNRQLKTEQDNPTIGLLLCKSANKMIVDYALEESKQPMGVAEYNTNKTLPPSYRDLLPSPEQFQHLLDTLKV